MQAGDTREFFCIEFHGYPLCGASSRLEEDNNWRRYHELNLFDGDGSTAWIAGGSSPGIGEEIWFEVEAGLGELHFINGCNNGELTYTDNNRIKVLKARLWAGILEPGRVTEYGVLFTAYPVLPSWAIELEDTPEQQMVKIDLDWEAAEEEMDRAIDAVEAFDSCVYILSLTVQEIYLEVSSGNTGITGISWNLQPEYSGPGGLGILDLRGVWENESGSIWERLVLEWNPFYQGWNAYVDDELYDSGIWEIGNGMLGLYSDGKMEQYYFHGWPLNGNRFVLIDEYNEASIWKVLQ